MSRSEEAMPAKPKLCENCKWYLPDALDPAKGDCEALPPLIVKVAQDPYHDPDNWVRPVVRKGNSCSLWERT